MIIIVRWGLFNINKKVTPLELEEICHCIVIEISKSQDSCSGMTFKVIVVLT
jgi:hypothetical protein